MFILARPRRGGKTYFLLQEWGHVPGSIIVCANIMSVRETQKAARAMFPNMSDNELNSRIISVTNKEGLIGMDHTDVCVDNADMVLSQLLGRPVTIMTATGVSL